MLKPENNVLQNIARAIANVKPKITPNRIPEAVTPKNAGGVVSQSNVLIDDAAYTPGLASSGPAKHRHTQGATTAAGRVQNPRRPELTAKAVAVCKDKVMKAYYKSLVEPACDMLSQCDELQRIQCI